MRVMLSIGECRLKVIFSPPYVPPHTVGEGMRVNPPRPQPAPRRETVITATFELKDGGIVNLEGFAECSPKDQFTKRMGRKVALLNFLAHQEFKWITKEDRALLWKAICPDFRQ